MKEINTEITYKNKTYKLVFNLNTMAEIQQEYGTLNKWSELANPSEHDGGEVDAQAVLFGFKAMLNEGIDISNEENNTNEPFLTLKQVGRMVTEISVDRMAELQRETIIRSTESAEKNA